METVNQSVKGKIEWSKNSFHVNFLASRFLLKANFLRSFFVMEFSKVLAGRRLSIAFSSKYFFERAPFLPEIFVKCRKVCFWSCGEVDKMWITWDIPRVTPKLH